MACGAPWSACAQNMRVARIETTCGVCASQAQVVRSRVRGYSPRRSCGPFPHGFVEGGDRQPLWPAADSRLREGPVQHLKPLLSSLQKKLMVRPHRAGMRIASADCGLRTGCTSQSSQECGLRVRTADCERGVRARVRRNADCECGLRTANAERGVRARVRRNADCGLRTADCERGVRARVRRNADCGLRII